MVTHRLAMDIRPQVMVIRLQALHAQEMPRNNPPGKLAYHCVALRYLHIQIIFELIRDVSYGCRY